MSRTRPMRWVGNQSGLCTPVNQPCRWTIHMTMICVSNTNMIRVINNLILYYPYDNYQACMPKMVKHAPINYSDFHSWQDFHWGGGGGNGHQKSWTIQKKRKPCAKSYARKLNSIYICRLRGSSYIITTNYEKSRPHVWDTRMVHQQINLIHCHGYICLHCLSRTAAQQFKNFRSSSLWTCGNMEILRSKNKITYFMILAWLSPFKFHRPLCCRCCFNTGTTS